MKRRLKSNVKYPLTAAIGDFARNRAFQKPSDTGKAKRVRFEETGRDGEAIQSPESGAPKTSEYAYFKNLKCGAVRDRSRAQREENDQKKAQINYLVRETSSASNKLKPSTEDLNFSVSGERAGPSDHNIHSPRVSKYFESDQIRSKELTNQIKTMSPLLSENVTPAGQSLFSSPLNKASEKAENQCSWKGTFSAKRQRLRQWAHSSHSEIEKHHLKGFDLVPLLLSRLFPKGNENNDSPKGNTVNSCKTVTVSKSNDLEDRLVKSRKRGREDDLPKACYDRWSDIVLAERDNFISGFPSNYRKENHLLDEFIDHDKCSMSHEYRSSHTRLGFPPCLPFESYRSSGYSHLNDPDEYGSIIEHHREPYKSSHTQLGFPLCLPFESYRSSGYSHLNDPDEYGSIIEHRREPYKLLLGWDSELGQDRLNSSIINHGIEKNVCTRLDNSWNVDQRRIADNVLDDNISSSLSSAYYLESNTVPNYTSKGCLMPDFAPEFNDVKCDMGELGRFPLALPHAPKCITMGEDKNSENVLSSSNIISSYRDEDWLNKKVWDGKPVSKFRWNCISAPDDYPSVFPEIENRLCSVSRLKEACVEEPFTPLYEGVSNRNFLSPLPRRSSLNTFINRPLLLDRESYFDDYDDDWDRDKHFRCTYGETLPVCRLYKRRLKDQSDRTLEFFRDCLHDQYRA